MTDPDPRIHFTLSYLSASSPHLHVYAPQTLEEDLQRAGMLYCQEHVEVHVAKRQVVLPEMFQKYAADFGRTTREIIIWMFQFLEDKKRIDLFSLMEKKNYIVHYKPNLWTPQIPLESSVNLSSIVSIFFS